MKLLENTFDSLCSFSAQMPPVVQNRKCIGAGISFFIHAAAVGFIFFLGPSLSDFKPPLVIDFSIEQSIKKAQLKKVVQQAPPEPILPQPMQKEIFPQTSFPETTEVVKFPKIEPLVTQQEVVEKKVQQEVVPEQIKETLEPVEENTPEEVVAVEDTATDELDLAPSSNVSTQAKPQQTENSLALHKQKYLKEHFNYIKEKVQKRIIYPPVARKMGWQGKVLVSFIICLDGSVKDIHIRESSGHKALDKNAIDVIRKGAPFPKPPVSAELIIPVVYKLS